MRTKRLRWQHTQITLRDPKTGKVLLTANAREMRNLALYDEQQTYSCAVGGLLLEVHTPPKEQN